MEQKKNYVNKICQFEPFNKFANNEKKNAHIRFDCIERALHTKAQLVLTSFTLWVITNI